MKTTATILSTAIAGVCFAWTPSASAIEAAVLDDTYSYTTTVQGAAPSMVIQNSSSRKAWLRFRLQKDEPSSAPQDAAGPLPLGLRSDEVSRAVLRMFVNGLTTGPVTLRVRAVATAWDEATLKSTLLPTVDAATITEVTVSTANEYIYFDLTTLVQDWIKYTETTPPGASGGRPNFGVMIESVTSGTGTVTIDSKESTTNFYESVIELLVESATVPARGDVSMGIFTAP